MASICKRSNLQRTPLTICRESSDPQVIAANGLVFWSVRHGLFGTKIRPIRTQVSLEAVFLLIDLRFFRLPDVHDQIRMRPGVDQIRVEAHDRATPELLAR